MINLEAPLRLPCGVILKNRLAKAAMTERIANSSNEPTEAHNRLYKTWAETGAGLLISGNIIVDRTHLESAGNICLTEEKDVLKLQTLTQFVTSRGIEFWAQLSHAGRQTNIFNSLHPLAPSSVKLHKMGLFGRPKAMSSKKVEETIQAYINSAVLAKKAGFTGVQIHAAHGYLISQFLSPITNKRKDSWGGSLENRSRFLKEVVRGTRLRLGPNFPISVKINSADFQRGGFSEEESIEVVKMLENEGIDLLEISGGTYEKMAFFEGNQGQKQSTADREAYFLEFAERLKQETSIPLMVTGGFRTRSTCENALKQGDLDLIGIARPFITNVQDIAGFLVGKVSKLEFLESKTRLKIIADSAIGGYYAKQLIKISKGEKVNVRIRHLSSALFLVSYELLMSLKKLHKS